MNFIENLSFRLFSLTNLYKYIKNIKKTPEFWTSMKEAYLKKKTTEYNVHIGNGRKRYVIF